MFDSYHKLTITAENHNLLKNKKWVLSSSNSYTKMSRHDWLYN